jgi:Family of unknown function (DUF5990)
LKAPQGKTLNFRIVGHNLPGLKFGTSAGALVDRFPVYLGIQRKSQVVDQVPGDSTEAVFRFPVEVVSGRGGALDFRGPFVHGDKGKRFIYLSWGVAGNDGSFLMFRRAKLFLSAIKPKDVLGALASGATAEGVINLTDDKGGPICGGAVSSKISWRVP